MKRRRFQRSRPELRYRKLFVISVEGSKTEPQYFDLFNSREPTIHVECLYSHKGDSDPASVLKRMEKYLRENALKQPYEAWLVVDRDQWRESQLQQLHDWATDSANGHLALSNPKFEYWLLLHFEDGKKIRSPRDCSQRLKKHLPDYDKGIATGRFTAERIRNAVKRARDYDSTRGEDWPRNTGTTVYRLVESLLKGNKKPRSTA